MKTKRKASLHVPDGKHIVTQESLAGTFGIPERRLPNRRRIFKIKIGIDLVMTALLLVQMGYQIVGQEIHEWLGAGMLVMFLLHNLLNIRWYGNLRKGRYTPIRMLQTAVNFSILAVMLCLGFSGMAMSRHVFAKPPIRGLMATGRMMHVAASHWGFVLMSVHLGLHWGMVMGMAEKYLNSGKNPAAAGRLLQGAGALTAAYGLYLFIQKDMAAYMFLKNEFVFFDFEKSVALVFGEYVAMMGFWVWAGFYGSRLLNRRCGLHSKQKPSYTWKRVCRRG